MTARILLALLLSLPVVACTGGGDEGATGDDQNVIAKPVAPRPGEIGGMCGGIAGIRCKDGLRCVLDGPGFDVAGTCEATATCLAMPSCDPGDRQVDSCPAGAPESQCYSRSMCGKTLSCEKVPAIGVEVTLEGTLESTVGIGGENTGTSLRAASSVHELVLDANERSRFVDGRFARVIGKKTELTGVETRKRLAVEVTNLLVCPASSAVINCQPPLAPSNTICGADRAWVQEKCTGVSFVD